MTGSCVGRRTIICILLVLLSGLLYLFSQTPAVFTRYAQGRLSDASPAPVDCDAVEDAFLLKPTSSSTAYFTEVWDLQARCCAKNVSDHPVCVIFSEDRRYPDSGYCPWDRTLDRHLGDLKGKTVLLAADLRNNEEVLPHVIQQIWHVVSILRGRIFVSIYESGSSDATGDWLDVLRELLTALDVPYRIVSGNLTSSDPRYGRIGGLARLRNEVLRPLWAGPGESNGGENPGPRGDSDGGVKALAANRTGTEGGAWPATHVVFTNDVFLCAGHVVRLLLQDADMACGFDLYRPHIPRTLRWLRGIPIIPYTKLQLYDIWVARDLTGAMLERKAPHSKDTYTQARLRGGLPFPVKSCWNGLVAIRAEPFVESGLRFREARREECFSSECKLICDDLVRLGYNKFTLDPSIRLAYHREDARDAYAPGMLPAIGVADWAAVAAAPPVDFSRGAGSNATACCQFGDHGDLDFDNCPLYGLLPDSP